MLKFSRQSIFSLCCHLGHFLFLVFVSLAIAAFSLMLGLRYWILPDIEKYHGEVVVLASRAVNLPVTIGKIQADWRGIRPHLTFSNVQILDGQGSSALELKRVEIDVSWMTLLARELRLKSLQVDDPEVIIRRDAQGILHVAGLQIDRRGGDSKAADWLLHQSTIVVRNGRIVWLDELNNRPELQLNRLELRVENRGKHHRFAAHISPLSTLSSLIDLRGDLAGKSFADLSAWKGELFAQINQANVTAWGAWLILPDKLKHAKGGARAWLEVEAGAIKRITADVDLGAVQSRFADDLPILNLSDLRGRLGWSQAEQSMEFSTRKLTLQTENGFTIKPTDIFFRYKKNKNNQADKFEFKVNAFELSDIAALVEYLPVEQTVRQNLLDYSPRGHVEDVSVLWQGDSISQANFAVKAQFEKISTRAVGPIPGVENLSGNFSGSDSGGNISLNSPQFKLDAPALLLQPLKFNTFSVQASWLRKQKDWVLSLNKFALANEDLAGTAYGGFQTSADSPGIADVTLNLTRASVRSAVRYLPKEFIGADAMTWLQSGLAGGEANEVYLRLRGNLNDFPFPENKQGIFQVKAKAHDVIIDYDKAWPRVEKAVASLLIEGRRLQVDSNYAILAGAQAQRVQVSIPDLLADELLLQIRGESKDETRHALNFIRHSPVREYINGFTDNTQAKGTGKLNLQVDIPLSAKPAKLTGKYHFDANEISLDKYIPLAQKVTGDLIFTESTLQADKIDAQILGGPATIDMQTAPGGELKVKAQGKINVEAWRNMDTAPWLHSLQGNTDWLADISLNGKQFSVVVTSNLTGLSSALPAPLAKHTHDSFPVKLELRSASDTQDVMWLQLGNLASARMVRLADKNGERNIKRGYIHFGSPRRIQDRDGIWVSGNIPLISLEGWSGLLSGENATSAGLPEVNGFDVNVKKIVGYDNIINKLNIHGRSKNGTVSAQVSADDLNGEISWFSQGSGKLVARLKNVAWGEKLNEEKASSTPAKAGKLDENVTTIPVIDVAIENFSYKGKTLGQIEFHASQFDQDLLLNHFRLTNADSVLVMNGKWSKEPVQTHIVANLTINDAGRALERVGYPNSVKNGKGILSCDLVWNGAPDEMEWSKVDGHVNLKMSKGQFLKLDPGAGKLLSVLSLQTLPKRVALDFNDVFSKGFEFDAITGVAQMRQGVVMTDDFKINGSSAQVTLAGQVDVVRETQSLRVKVMPTIGDSVSLLAFAAGPAVGAGVYIANKLLRDPLDKLVSFEYNVSGSWVDPNVEKIRQAPISPGDNSNN
ncbi:MAG: YhdP family protein [Gallionellaceae bacterium]